MMLIRVFDRREKGWKEGNNEISNNEKRENRPKYRGSQKGCEQAENEVHDREMCIASKQSAS